MKVVVVGATGTIGRAVVNALAPRHEIIAVSHKSGPNRLDLAKRESIEAAIRSIGQVDALINVAGLAKFGSLSELTDGDFQMSLGNKLMGQVNLVRLAVEQIADNGSVTLTSGALGRFPMPGSAAISLVSAGIEGFVRAAALEMPRGIRINAVSPGWVTETLKSLGMDPGGGTPSDVVAAAYVQSLEGDATGQIIDPVRTT
jgi:NAD(P)-dependent dehydrogenase (short-subunit alcohol dehydrogenase family)